MGRGEWGEIRRSMLRSLREKYGVSSGPEVEEVRRKGVEDPDRLSVM